jgi:hypothetical protein
LLELVEAAADGAAFLVRREADEQPVLHIAMSRDVVARGDDRGNR